MSIIIYLLLLAAAALFYPLYSDTLSFIVLVTMIILPVFMLIELIISAVFFKCDFSRKNTTVFKGDEGEVALKLHNRSVFPLSNVRVAVRIVFSPSDTIGYYRAVVPLPALKTQTVTVNVAAKHCGKATVTVEYVRICDLLGIFKLKLCKKKLSSNLYIVPKIADEYAALAKSYMELSTEQTDESTEEKPKGNVTVGDVCGFREFAAGDRLSQMHYKLSARFDSDIVKIYSQSAASKFVVCADLSEQDFSNDSLAFDKRDELLQKMMSLAYYLYQYNADTFVAVADDNDNITTEQFCENSSYFSIARAICDNTLDLSAPAFENGSFICCLIKGEDN